MVLDYVLIINGKIYALNVKEHIYVPTIKDLTDVRIVEGVLFVNMLDIDMTVKIVAVLEYVNIISERKTVCKDCGGGSLCYHNILRTRCKDCGGGTICEHNRRRSACRDCKKIKQNIDTSSKLIICLHEQFLFDCEECNKYYELI